MTTFFDDLINSLVNAFSGTAYGETPKPNIDYMVIDKTFGRGLKWMITYRVNRILDKHPGKSYKFGKTGQGITRAEWDDYVNSSYRNMYFLYETTSENHVSELEVYNIKKHKQESKNDNIRDTKFDNISRESGRYHVYLMI